MVLIFVLQVFENGHCFGVMSLPEPSVGLILPFPALVAASHPAEHRLLAPSGGEIHRDVVPAARNSELFYLRDKDWCHPIKIPELDLGLSPSHLPCVDSPKFAKIVFVSS